MRPVESIPVLGGQGIRKNDGGVNSTMTYCKNFRNVTVYSQHNNNNNNNNNKFYWNTKT
jgi:hypothetical protein